METYNRDLHTHTVKEYEMKKNTLQRDLTIGISLGLFVGSVIGLMVAQKSGKALQQDIGDKFVDIKDKLEQKQNQTNPEIKAQQDAIKKEVNNDQLKEPIAIVDKELPIKEEAEEERKKTIIETETLKQQTKLNK
ncbi:YtxH domain-containing protein [Macrococcus sp. DPC7161]|uniref:YtxH domain-containing protein n=1 Tax=Macrococcus sp. DPC7161 TaxID=2507060 RepID=UPI00100B7678|nr:YtxH domain-containing protein [Macrococcus sp. DPC7161]RXK18276.1 YtxH domain-containing protein [Macrococcus sp. DPC7161]